MDDLGGRRSDLFLEKLKDEIMVQQRIRKAKRDFSISRVSPLSILWVLDFWNFRASGRKKNRGVFGFCHSPTETIQIQLEIHRKIKLDSLLRQGFQYAIYEEKTNKFGGPLGAIMVNFEPILLASWSEVWRILDVGQKCVGQNWSDVGQNTIVGVVRRPPLRDFPSK